MTQLLAVALPLALGAAISPILVILQLLILSGKRSPAARSWAFVLGGLGMLVAVSVLTALFVNGVTDRSSRPSVTASVVQLVIAALLVALGIRGLLSKGKGGHSRVTGRIETAKTIEFVAIGFAAMLANASTWVLVIAAVHSIAIAPVGVVDKLVVYLLVLLIALIPVLALSLAATFAGSRAAPMLARLNTLMTKHQKVIGAAVCFAFAVLLAYKGLTGL